MSLIERSVPRNIQFTKNINPYASGSVIVEFGNTKIHITAFIEENVPSWLKGKGRGWVTAEYNMLPGATHTRSRRERSKVGGRTMEIQRLIARALRSVVNLEKLGERLITLDCDVLVADGGTRTASISGAYIALKMTLDELVATGVLKENPITGQLAAISVGVSKNNKVIADLNYEEDSSCEVDMNVVMTRDGRFVEVQGTAEGEPFDRDHMNAMLECAEQSMKIVFEKQDEIINS